MGEFDYIAWLRRRTPASPGVMVGPGDDCAVIAARSQESALMPAAALPGCSWLVTTDMLLEGSHFILADTDPRRIGRKAMAVNLSDIAAMGGKPVAAVVSLGLPRHQTQKVAEQLYLGMRDLADAFDTAIAGGDTNTWHGGLVLAVTVFGVPGPQGPILRSGARPGDWLFVTGSLGGSILGKHLDFTPRVHEGLQLQEHVALHAMIDLSDGLSADVYHLGAESGCGVLLDAERIPISSAAMQLHDGKKPLDHALGDGEDFELAFAVAPEDGERLLRSQPLAKVTLAHIGVFVPEQGLFLQEHGQRCRIEPAGFIHEFS